MDASKLKISVLAANTETRVPAYEVKSDEAIKEAVEDAFLLDPRVPKEKVRVSVEKGKVRLTGTVHGIAAKRAATLEGKVDTWAERRAAVRVALSGGAKQVINKVAVTEQG